MMLFNLSIHQIYPVVSLIKHKCYHLQTVGETSKGIFEGYHDGTENGRKDAMAEDTVMIPQDPTLSGNNENGRRCTIHLYGFPLL